MGVLHFGVNYVVAGAKNRFLYGFVWQAFGFCSVFMFHVIQVCHDGRGVCSVFVRARGDSDGLKVFHRA